MRLGTLLGALFIGALLAGAARGDEVILKNGRSMRGKIVKETDKEVILKTDIGKIPFRRSQIKEVRRSKPARKPAKVEPKAGPPATPKSEPKPKPDSAFALSGDRAFVPLIEGTKYHVGGGRSFELVRVESGPAEGYFYYRQTGDPTASPVRAPHGNLGLLKWEGDTLYTCLLYTSDAADE